MNDTDDFFIGFSASREGEKINFQMRRGSTLSELLKNFKHFLNASGFEYVKVIEAKDDSGNYFTSDEDGMYIDSDESDLPF